MRITIIRIATIIVIIIIIIIIVIIINLRYGMILKFHRTSQSLILIQFIYCRVLRCGMQRSNR